MYVRSQKQQTQPQIQQKVSKKTITAQEHTGTTGSPSSSNPSLSPSPGPDAIPCPNPALVFHRPRQPPWVSLLSLLLLLQVPQQQVAVV